MHKQNPLATSGFCRFCAPDRNGHCTLQNLSPDREAFAKVLSGVKRRGKVRKGIEGREKGERTLP